MTKPATEGCCSVCKKPVPEEQWQSHLREKHGLALNPRNASYYFKGDEPPPSPRPASEDAAAKPARPAPPPERPARLTPVPAAPPPSKPVTDDKPQRRRGPRTTISPEEFVRIWQTSASIVDAAKALGTTTIVATQRALSYRKRGIPLKKFESAVGRGAALDVGALKALAEELAPKPKAK